MIRPIVVNTKGKTKEDVIKEVLGEIFGVEPNESNNDKEEDNTNKVFKMNIQATDVDKEGFNIEYDIEGVGHQILDAITSATANVVIDAGVADMEDAMMVGQLVIAKIMKELADRKKSGGK